MPEATFVHADFTALELAAASFDAVVSFYAFNHVPRELLAPTNGQGWRRDAPVAHRFVASDAPDHFLRLGQRFLGSAIECVETVTLG